MKEEKKIYLEQLRRGFFESSLQFEKQILVIASGALGLSLAFIKDIIQLNVATNKPLLVLSWVSFSIVIFISILSSYTSLKAMNSKIENLNDSNYESKFNALTKFFNFIMILLLALGLILLNTFISINI